MTRRERLARERVVTAQLAIAAAAADGRIYMDDLYAEAVSARRALYQLVVVRGRQQ